MTTSRHVMVDGRAFELQQVVRDGDLGWLLVCPKCGKRGLIDDDQLHGRVSIVCGIEGCEFHETHDFETAAGWPPSHSMVVQLREALGLPAGALAITPQRMWEEALAEVRRLRKASRG